MGRHRDDVCRTCLLEGGCRVGDGAPVSIRSSTTTQRRSRTSPIRPSGSEALRLSGRRAFCMKAMSQSRWAAYFCAILPRPGSGATTTRSFQPLARTHSARAGRAVKWSSGTSKIPGSAPCAGRQPSPGRSPQR